MMIFCTFRFEKSLLELLIRDITKLDKELFHNFVSLAPQDFLSAFVEIIFWFIKYLSTSLDKA